MACNRGKFLLYNKYDNKNLSVIFAHKNGRNLDFYYKQHLYILEDGFELLQVLLQHFMASPKQ